MAFSKAGFHAQRVFIASAATWIALTASGYAGRQASDFQTGRPVFDPTRYFLGRTHSWGIIESRSGAPGQIISTRTEGHWQGDIFHFEQDIQFEKGKRQHRSWRLRRVDAHHYVATGTGIVGEARADAYGNVLHLQFTLDASPGNPLFRVKMEQWMYLQPDGRTMINRDVLKKAGIVIAHITEQFTKDNR